jgi:hypothetical protein
MSSLRMYPHQNHDTDMFAFQQFYLLCDKREFLRVVSAKNDYRCENLTAASINASANARVK